jgi:outer membrane autotransporter protein
LNTSYRSIWNHALNAWVAVSEITRARGKRSASTMALVTVTALAGGLGASGALAQSQTYGDGPAIGVVDTDIGGTLTAPDTVTTADQQGVIFGTGGVVKEGGGILTLSGPNSYFGGTTVNDGILRVLTDANLGAPSGAVTLNGGTLRFGADNFSSVRAFSATGLGGTIDVAGTAGNVLSGPFNATGLVSFINSAPFDNTQTVRLTLSGTNSFAGGVAIGVSGGSDGRTNVLATGADNFGVAGTKIDLYTNSAVGFDGAAASAQGLVITAHESTNVGGSNSGTEFTHGAHAGDATINNLALGSYVLFANDSNADSATINNSNGGIVYLENTAQAGGATINNNAGSFVRIDNTDTGISIGQLTGEGNVLLGDKALTVGALNQDGAIGGVISGSALGSVVKVGTGTLTLRGTNTYGGGTTINAGAVAINNAQALGTGAVALNGGKLVGTADMSLNTVLNFGTAGTVAAAANTTLALTNTISNPDGSNAIFGSPTESGVVNLVGPVVAGLTSGLRVAGGTLRADNFGGLDLLTSRSGASTTVDAGATLDFSGFDSTIGNLQGAGTVQGGINPFANLTVQAGNFSGNIIGADGLVKTTSDTLVLSGTNSYTGATNITAGTVQAGAANVLPGTTAVTVSPGATLDLNGQNLTIGSMAGAGNVTLGAGTLASGDANNTSFSGVISGTGSVVKNGSGTWTLANNNAYGGTTSVVAGTLQAGVTNALPTGTALSIASGASFDLNGQSQTVASLAGAGSVALGAGTLTVGDTTSTSFSGNIAGAGDFVKNGSGSLALSGTNSYDGTTSVNAGTLFVNGNQSNSKSAVNVASGATLGGSGVIAGPVTIASGAILAPGNSPGTLTMGALTLNTGSILNYEFGQSGTPGGPLNDLTVVNGDLALAGTLNVTQSGGGNFLPGVYRIFDYTGTLSGSLALGTAPVPLSGLTVQTSAPNQVNLVNSTGVTLQYWDNAAGTWQGTAGNSNWTDLPGTAANPWAQGAFAVFRGAGGNVSVDGVTNGPVSFQGAQFTTDGYVLSGDTLNASTATTDLRVGAGGAGAGLTATINAVIDDASVAGGTQVVKSDPGTLVLGAANTYRGGTAVNGGTLQVSADDNLGAASGGLSFDGGTLKYGSGFATARAVTLNAGGGSFDTNGNDATLDGAIGGSGSFTKTGLGTLTQNGASTIGGATLVAAGTLSAGAANVLSAASAHTVAAGATLALNGNSQTVASLANAGTVSLVGSAPGTTLTVNGAYVGNGGTLALGTVLGANGISDRLVLNGAGASASGSTNIAITNFGGLGAMTAGNGIEVVTAQGGATSTKTAFALNGGHVDAGAFQYRLYAADASGNGSSWYLRTQDGSTGTPTQPALPTYRAEVPVYAALPNVLRQADLQMLGNLHRRVGDEGRMAAPAAGTANDTGSGWGTGARRAWGRVLGGTTTLTQNGMAATDTRASSEGLQVGVDLFANDRWNAGLYVGTLRTDARVNGAFGLGGLMGYAGSFRADTQYLAGYATYANPQGQYADFVLQYGRQDVRTNTLFSPNASTDGSSLTASAEVGQRFALGNGWSVEPQAQLIYHRLNLDNTAISGFTTVVQDPDNAVLGRIGVRFAGDIATSMGRLQPYARINLWHGFGGSDRATYVAPAGATTIANGIGYTSTELAAGFTLGVSKTVSVYGEVGKLFHAGGGDARVRSSVEGSLGVKLAF